MGKTSQLLRSIAVACTGATLLAAGGCARDQARPDETVATAECPVGAGSSTFAVREKGDRLQVRVTSGNYDQAQAIQHRAEAIALVLMRTEAQPSDVQASDGVQDADIRRVEIEALPAGVLMTFRGTDDDNLSALRARVENHLQAWQRRSCQIAARPLEG